MVGAEFELPEPEYGFGMPPERSAPIEVAASVTLHACFLPVYVGQPPTYPANHSHDDHRRDCRQRNEPRGSGRGARSCVRLGHQSILGQSAPNRQQAARASPRRLPGSTPLEERTTRQRFLVRPAALPGSHHFRIPLGPRGSPRSVAGNAIGGGRCRDALAEVLDGPLATGGERERRGSRVMRALRSAALSEAHYGVEVRGGHG